MQKKQLVVKETNYQVIARNLYKLDTDGLLRRCVSEHERPMILSEAHERVAGGHYVVKTMTQNILHPRIWWPTLHKEQDI